MIALTPGTYGKFRLHPAVNWGTVLLMWYDSLLPIHQTKVQIRRGDPVYTTMLVTSQHTQAYLRSWNFDHQIIAFFSVQNELFLIPFERAEAWQEFINRYPWLSAFAFDDTGCIPHDFRPDMHLKPVRSPHFVEKVLFLENLVQALFHIRMNFKVPKDTDVLRVEFQGTVDQLTAVVSLWHLAFPDTWTSTHGRLLAFEHISDLHVQFLFLPNGKTTVTPAHVLKSMMTIRLFATLMATHHSDSNDIALMFKLDQRIICQVKIAPDFAFAPVFAYLAHSFYMQLKGNGPRIVCAGRQLGDAALLTDVRIRTSQQQRFVLCQLTRPLTGGGGNKADHKQALHAAIAAACIENGVQLKQVPTAVTTLLHEEGISKLTKIMFHDSPDYRQSQFVKLCQKHDIEVKDHVSIQKVQPKMKKTIANTIQREHRNIDVALYQLEPGFFLMENHTPAPVNRTFSPCTPGITMATPAEAVRWTAQRITLLPDELGLFIVGDAEPEIIQNAQHVIAPARNSQGERVLIAGFLYQLGDKSIQPKTEEDTVQLLDTQVCSFTLWKQDFPDDKWAAATEAPVKFARQLLQADSLEDSFGNPWGRTYRQGTKPCSPHASTSIQFHAEVRIQSLRRLLRRSGFNRLFVCPKDQLGKPSSAWRPIWIETPIQQLETQTAMHPATAGYIRGLKSSGIRVESQSFEEIWKLLKPSSPLPESIPAGTIWKLRPLPHGVDREVIKEWLAQQEWKAFPVKPVAAQAWLVSSQQPPPAGIVCFNTTPILITKVQSRSTGEQIGLVAGPPSASQEPASSDAVARSIFRTGDPYFDPWQPKAPDQTKPAQSSYSQQIEHQDARISQMEKVVAQIHNEVEEQSKQNGQRHDLLQQQITANHNAAQTAFATLRQDFESTLNQAMQHQTQRLSTTVDEIKNLILRNDKRKNTDADSAVMDAI